MLQIAVCEDEQADRDNLIGILKLLLDKYEEEYQITNFTSGGELLQSGDSFHLIFMDIMMEGRNGIETGQELYSRNHSAKIIYTTNFGQYCMDAVNTVHAFAFLEKPVDKLSLMPGDMVIRNSIEVAFSKLVLIFFYYALMRRLWKKDYRQSRT